MKKYQIERKYYISAGVLSFLVMIIWILNVTGLLYVFWNYAFSASYRSIFEYKAHGLNPDASIFTVIHKLIREYHWEFDYCMSESLTALSLIIPVLSSVTGLLLFRKYHSIYRFCLYRQESRRIFIRGEAVQTSLLMAGMVFIAVLVQYLLVYMLSKGMMYGNVGSHILLDWFGEDFYYTHPYMYWLLNCMIRCFLVPFCYGMMACGAALLCSSLQQTFWTANAYYYGAVLLTDVFRPYGGVVFDYFNPYVLMADGGSFFFVNYHTGIMIVTGAIMPLLAGLLCMEISYGKETG